MKKTISILCAASMLAALVLPGCSGGDAGSSAAATSNASGASGSSAAAAADVPKFEDIQFPDDAPASGITPEKDDKRYAYDDMSKKYTIDIMMSNNGVPALAEGKDPIRLWLEKKFNISIKFESLTMDDLKTSIATRSASGDLPDLFMAPDQATAKSLYEQGLLLDGKQVYPYLPLVRQYVTKNMVKYTTDDDGGLYCTTNYQIQDGVWTFCYRQDWLKKFNMEIPKTEAELMDFAKKCTFDDPDGNGKADTYFMISACNGGSPLGGMNGGFTTMYGDPAVHAESGALSHPNFNGVRKKVLTLLHSFVEAKVLYPDWYTIEWSKAQPYQFNDKIGCVYEVPMTFIQQYMAAKNHEPGYENVWTCASEAPVEGGKFAANGNPGFLWCWSKSGFSDEGKLKRVAHMVDSCEFGGENFFHTIQGGSDEVWKAAGYSVETPRTWKYNDDGTFYYSNASKGSPWCDNSLIWATSPWQQFGLIVPFQRNSPTGDDPQMVKENVAGNKLQDIESKEARWPNTGLLCPISDESVSPGITDYVNAQELAFVTGKRPLSEWDAYTKEWLAKGGKKIIEADAKQLGVPVPDYAK